MVSEESNIKVKMLFIGNIMLLLSKKGSPTLPSAIDIIKFFTLLILIPLEYNSTLSGMSRSLNFESFS